MTWNLDLFIKDRGTTSRIDDESDRDISRMLDIVFDNAEEFPIGKIVIEMANGSSYTWTPELVGD